LPKIERGNEYILTLQDYLTKFCIEISLLNQTSETIAEVFMDKFICTLKAPKTILTDQGKNFISDLMKKVAKIFRIRNFVRPPSIHIRRIQYANEQKQWDKWIVSQCSIIILAYMKQQNMN